jgi:hypothetical protein
VVVISQARQKFSEIATKLAQRAHQFRSIQKRLLVRFKDRNPAPLQHLDVLLEGTFQQLNALGTLMEACQKDLKGAADRLSAGCAPQCSPNVPRMVFGLCVQVVFCVNLGTFV